MTSKSKKESCNEEMESVMVKTVLALLGCGTVPKSIIKMRLRKKNKNFSKRLTVHI